MPMTSAWDDPATKKIIIQTITPPWTLQEAYRVAEENHNMMTEVTHNVHIISLMPPLYSLPKDILSLAQRASQFASPNEGYHIFVTSSRFVLILIALFEKIIPNRRGKMRMAKSEMVARQMLAELDPTLKK